MKNADFTSNILLSKAVESVQELIVYIVHIYFEALLY